MGGFSAAPHAPRGGPEAVLALPAKYRDVVYLFYYEQYTASEIAALLRRNENTVYTQLKRAKALLRESLGDDADG